MGAPHGSEVAYVLGTLGTSPNGPKYNATDREVSSAIEAYWTNFAKTGDPNGGALPRCPAFDPTARAYLDFNAEGPVAKEGLRRQICDLYTDKLRRQIAQ